MSNIAEAIFQHVHAKVKWNIQYQNIYIPVQLPQCGFYILKNRIKRNWNYRLSVKPSVVRLN